jgi:uncharacterized membrane protein YfcA
MAGSPLTYLGRTSDPHMSDLLVPTLVCLTFLAAGAVKGVIGLGLPTVAIGLLAIVMTPAHAAALLVVPTLATNLWQLMGAGLTALLRRLWTMLLGICVGSWLGAGTLAGDTSGRATAALGAALIAFALLGLSPLRFSVPPRAEPWLSPLIGVATGIVTAATGVFAIPSVPYLQALGLDKDALVQALGVSFTVSTLALGVDLMRAGVLEISVAATSLAALAPALIGMMLGQWLRRRIRAELFRVCFLVGLIVLGSHLILRVVL